MRILSGLPILLGAIMLVLPGFVTAAVVEAALFKEQAGSSSFSLPVPGTASVDLQGFDEFSGLSTQIVAVATTSGGERPQADVQGHVSWSVAKPDNLSQFDVLNLVAEASVLYHVAVEPVNGDPNDFTQVPIVLEARGHVDADGPTNPGGGNTTTALALAQGPGLNEMVFAPSGISGFDREVKVFLTPNIAQSVFVRARGSISIPLFGLHSGTAEFQAVADPLIVIDPLFELRDQYRLVFSSNLAVPLPAALWLFGTALLALLNRMNRGQTHAAA